MNELLVVDKVKAVEIFGGGGLDKFLAEITREAKSVVADVGTNIGRKDIASMAAKVSKSKTYLDSLGKDLVADWKMKSKLVDSDRKIMRDTLDDLKTEIRKPLTDWENAEKERVDGYERKISQMITAGSSSLENWMTIPLVAMNSFLDTVEKTVIDKSWEEFEDQAQIAKELSIKNITTAITNLFKYDADQLELQKLRNKEESRVKKDEAEKLKKELERRAKHDAEAALINERAQLEKEKQDAANSKALSEKREQEARENAKRRVAMAEQNARKKVEHEQEIIVAAKKAREENEYHKSKIHNDAIAAMAGLGIDHKDALMLVNAIAANKIPNITINY